MKQALVLVLATVTLVGCGGRHAAGEISPAATGAEAVPPIDWRTTATLADRDRLRRWRSAWLDALSRARAGGAGSAIAGEGDLLVPDASLASSLPPPGTYRCRVFKLGAKSRGMSDFAVYPNLSCRIKRDGALLRFEMTSGAQRPVGRIFPDAAGRPVFLGTLMLAGEIRPIAYGRDIDRDMAGFVDRVGERRWRLVLPLPAFESLVDVIELVPAAS